LTSPPSRSNTITFTITNTITPCHHHQIIIIKMINITWHANSKLQQHKQQPPHITFTPLVYKNDTPTSIEQSATLSNVVDKWRIRIQHEHG